MDITVKSKCMAKGKSLHLDDWFPYLGFLSASSSIQITINLRYNVVVWLMFNEEYLRLIFLSIFILSLLCHVQWVIVYFINTNLLLQLLSIFYIFAVQICWNIEEKENKR